MTKAVADDIVDCCKTVVGLEDRFIDLAFETGPVHGMTPDDIKRYIRFIADWRLRQLDLPEVYGVKENPLPWLQRLLRASSTPTSSRRARRNIQGGDPGQLARREGVWAQFEKVMASREPAEVAKRLSCGRGGRRLRLPIRNADIPRGRSRACGWKAAPRRCSVAEQIVATTLPRRPKGK